MWTKYNLKANKENFLLLTPLQVRSDHRKYLMWSVKCFKSQIHKTDGILLDALAKVFKDH